MNTDYNKEFENHLNEIATFWEAPSNFWTAGHKFALDSNVLKDLLEAAFIKGTKTGFTQGITAGKEEAFSLYSKIK